MANETEKKKVSIQPHRISIDVGIELWPCVSTLKRMGHRTLSKFIREALRKHWRERGADLERQAQAAQAEQEQMIQEARKIFEGE